MLTGSVDHRTRDTVLTMGGVHGELEHRWLGVRRAEMPVASEYALMQCQHVM